MQKIRKCVFYVSNTNKPPFPPLTDSPTGSLTLSSRCHVIGILECDATHLSIGPRSICLKNNTKEYGLYYILYIMYVLYVYNIIYPSLVDIYCSFHNLKSKYELNVVSPQQSQQIWIPQVFPKPINQ